VQSNVNEQRRDIPSWDGPNWSGEQFAVIYYTCLQPRLELPAYTGAGVDLSEDGGGREALEALGAIGVQDLLGLTRDRREDGIDRILTTAPRTKAIAVGFKAGFPFGFERGFDQRLACPIGHHGNP